MSRPSRYLALLAVLAVVAAVFAAVIVNDHLSCERGSTVRSSLRSTARIFGVRAVLLDQRARLDPGRLAVLDRRAAADLRATARRLMLPAASCSGVFPGAGGAVR